MTEARRQPARLASGGRIDRDRPIRFRFDGRSYEGYHGDSLASALLANGIHLVGRSFKYHRPRGIFSSGEEEPCALVETGEGDARIPNRRAPLVPLREGLVARPQKGWPSLRFDAGRIFDFTHRLWPAGFYNKTFMWPSWGFWEGLVRRTAGLGRPLDGPDPDHYEQVNAHCDLLVIGGGPAGLAAALTAGRAGLRVMLVDQGDRFGGILNRDRIALDSRPGQRWVDRVVDELNALPGVMVLSNTTAVGVYDHLVTTLLQTGVDTDWRECLWTVRPRRILLAAGAIEQGLIFPGNDRPGVMLAGAVRHYLNRWAVKAGSRVVVATNNDSAYQTVFDLAAESIDVAAVVDTRDTIESELERRLASSGIEVYRGAHIVGTQGGRRIRAVRVAPSDGSRPIRLSCDLLAVSGGWAPRVHLAAHARGELRFDEHRQAFLPGRLPDGMAVAGQVAGAESTEQALAQGRDAAADLCRALGRESRPHELPVVSADSLWAGRTGTVEIDTDARARQWIDLAHDVTLGDAELAVQEGFVPVEHFKRYTTTGMSVDQGKTGNLNAFIVLGALTGRDTGAVGTTTYRPPYVPVTLGAIAGRRTGEFYAPRRFLPAHTVHQSLNARFEDYGWQRPDAYPQEGESLEDAIRREVLAVRSGVGVFDNSPIGKLEVFGPDAAEFLNRLYINDVPGLAVGRARYGMMLNENGVIIDDGVFARLAEDRFLVNTTSAGVERIGGMMEEWLQCEWPGLRAVVDDATTQWANFTVAGPRARELVAALGTDVDLDAEALPHMGVAVGALAGLEARIARVSFSGELSFELNVPARCGAGLLQAILAAGEPFGLTPYGIEALMILRLEKGYLHVGSDTDGSTTPDDVGWGRVARRKQSDFIGRRSLDRVANRAGGRNQLVGLQALDAARPLRAGGHLLVGENRQPPALTDGWITSAAFSPTLGRHIALGMLKDGRERLGSVLTVCDEDDRYRVKVVPSAFHDPENQKLGA